MSERRTDPPDSPGETDPVGTVRVVDRRWWARGEGETDSVAGAGSGLGKPTYIEELERQIANKDEQVKDLAARFQAVSREFEDTRSRLRREVAKDTEREKRRLLSSFLEIVDNLDRAIAAAHATAADSDAVSNLLQGVELVRQQFLNTLNGHGVQPIEAAGETFDPNWHDAVSTVPVTEPQLNDRVVDVVKPGYRVADEVLRPATVTVGRLVESETATGPRRR